MNTRINLVLGSVKVIIRIHVHTTADITFCTHGLAHREAPAVRGEAFGATPAATSTSGTQILVSNINLQ